MKRKNFLKLLSVAIVLTTFALSSLYAQSPGPVIVGGNSYAFYYSGGTNYGLYFNLTGTAYEFKDGTGATVFSVNANSGRVDANGTFYANSNIRFGATSDLLIDADRYAFRYRLGTNYGLFFNATQARYEFRDATAASVFYIAANTGNLVATGGIQVGNSSLANAGNIRWNGTDFQGYNGTNWVSFTSGGGSLPSGATDQTLRHDGTTWAATNGVRVATDDRVFIGTAVSNNSPGSFTDLTNVTQVNHRTTTGAGHAGLYVEREGTSGSTNGGSSWSVSGVDAGIKAYSYWGNRWSAAIAGYSFLDYDSSAAIIGSKHDGSKWGALGYQAAGGAEYAGYFNGDVHITGNLTGVSLPGASWTVAGNDQYASTTGNVGIGFSVPNYKLHVGGGIVSEHQLALGGAINNHLVAASPGPGFYPAVGFITLSSGNGCSFFGIDDPTGGINLGDVNGIGYAPINASAFNVSSDRTLKRDIQPINTDNYEKYLNYLRQIESAEFFYNTETGETRQHPHIGVIAQSLPQELVAHIDERSNGSTKNKKLGVSLADHVGLNTAVLKALDHKLTQEEAATEDLTARVSALENTVAEQSRQIEMLLNELRAVKACTNCDGHKDAFGQMGNSSDRARLEQNLPNPFNGTTKIGYYLPQNTTNAQLVVFDMKGQMIQTFPLSGSGNGSVEFGAGELPSGVYLYTLMVNGVKVDTKRMVLNR